MASYEAMPVFFFVIAFPANDGESMNSLPGRFCNVEMKNVSRVDTECQFLQFLAAFSILEILISHSFISTFGSP
jgi:hypothetical protein